MICYAPRCLWSGYVTYVTYFTYVTHVTHVTYVTHRVASGAVEDAARDLDCLSVLDTNRAAGVHAPITRRGHRVSPQERAARVCEDEALENNSTSRRSIAAGDADEGVQHGDHDLQSELARVVVGRAIR